METKAGTASKAAEPIPTGNLTSAPIAHKVATIAVTVIKRTFIDYSSTFFARPPFLKTFAERTYSLSGTLTRELATREAANK